MFSKPIFSLDMTSTTTSEAISEQKIHPNKFITTYFTIFLYFQDLSIYSRVGDPELDLALGRCGGRFAKAWTRDARSTKVVTGTSLDSPELESSFGKGMRRSRNQWRAAPFHWMGYRHSVNEGIGKEFYRKGNSVKRFRPFSESPDSKHWKFLCSSPSRISAPTEEGNVDKMSEICRKLSKKLAKICAFSPSGCEAADLLEAHPKDPVILKILRS